MELTGGASYFTLVISIIFFPIAYKDIKWYYMLLMCLVINTIFWLVIAISLNSYRNKKISSIH